MAVRFQIVNHHPSIPVDLPLFQRVAEQVAAIHPPRALSLIDVAIVTDEAIAGVHGQFLNDPAPTDVLSFPHGEILVSLDTAMRCHRLEGTSLEEELALYLIHGLLHLAGFDDKSPADAGKMKAEQERILATIGEISRK